jgi:hypothetical protein
MTGQERRERSVRPDRLFVPDKDPEFEYRWMNCSAGPQGDQNMYMAQYDGWEPAPMDDKLIPPGILTASQQQISSPGGGTAHRRGDLVLYRMRKEMFDKTIRADADEARKRGDVTLDTMVMQAQENAARALRARGQKRIPGNLVFREDVGDPHD